MKKLSLLLIITVCTGSCTLFNNTDFSTLINDAGGSISLSDAALNPGSIPMLAYTNVAFSVRIVNSTGTVRSVEVDLSALGMGLVSLNNSDDVWSNRTVIRAVSNGVFPVIYTAVNQYGKSQTATNYITVFQIEAVYVEPFGLDKNAGTDPMNPVATIWTGIQRAYELGAKEVRVATGDYVFNQPVALEFQSGTQLVGGYNTTFSQHDPSLYPTVLDGDGATYHLISLSGVQNCKIKDLVIRNGWALNDFSTDKQGGAILALNSGLEINNCLFTNNQSLGDGGAVYSYNSSVIISNCTFHDNHAGNDGGALYAYGATEYSIYYSTLSNNTAQSGGGLNIRNAVLTLDQVVISSNKAETSGGGLFASNVNMEMNHSAVIHCLVETNWLGSGGMKIVNSSLSIENNLIASNTTIGPGGYAGGINLRDCTASAFNYNILVFNSNISTTTTYARGGGMIIFGSTFNSFIGNQFRNNYGYAEGAGIHFESSTASMISNSFISNVMFKGYGIALFASIYNNLDLLYNRFEANTNIGGTADYTVYLTGSSDKWGRFEYNVFKGNDSTAFARSSMYPLTFKNNQFIDTVWKYYDENGAYNISNINVLNSLDENYPANYNAGSVNGNIEL